MENFWKFWTISNIGFLILGYLGIFQSAIPYLLLADFTYISFVIIFLAVLLSVYLMIYHKQISSGELSTKKIWYFPGLFISLGMLGTIIGLVFMLSSIFVGFDPSNVIMIRELIAQFSNGMSTAFVTTLVGISCSIWTSLQILAIEKN